MQHLKDQKLKAVVAPLPVQGCKCIGVGASALVMVVGVQAGVDKGVEVSGSNGKAGGAQHEDGGDGG